MRVMYINSPGKVFQLATSTTPKILDKRRAGLMIIVFDAGPERGPPYLLDHANLLVDVPED